MPHQKSWQLLLAFHSNSSERAFGSSSDMISLRRTEIWSEETKHPVLILGSISILHVFKFIFAVSQIGLNLFNTISFERIPCEQHSFLMFLCFLFGSGTLLYLLRYFPLAVFLHQYQPEQSIAQTLHVQAANVQMFCTGPSCVLILFFFFVILNQEFTNCTLLKCY